MNWFEKHLNWSLFLAISVVPSIIFGIFFGIFFITFYGGLAGLRASGAGEAEIESFLVTSALPFVIIYFIIILGNLVFDIIVTLWYLGQKARNKWLILLLFVPFGLIILLLLENQAVGYGGDFVYESASDRWPDSGPTGGYDDGQTTGPDYTKELDYTPSQNVLDIAASQPSKDIRYTSDIPKGVDSGTVQAAGEKAPEPEKVIERAVSPERLKMPILLDDAGAVISCFYHPGADAVNLCSRCNKYVCIECNYITGTHPICHNCWEKRTAIPISPPTQKVGPAARQPEKKKVVESAEPEMQPAGETVEPEKPMVAEIVSPAEPVNVAPSKPEEQKVAKPEKSAKEEVQQTEWQSEFIAVYQQASPIIHIVVSKSADGMPASPLDLMEGLKLRPMLDRVKKLSKPKNKELREAKGELEQVLSSCIKIADAAADFVSGGGQALLGGPDFKRIVEGIEKADVLMEKLSPKMANFTQ